MAREGCRIAVIGAGFSGVMTAIHLLWRCEPGERVYLVERGDRVGPGLAYGTAQPAPSGQRPRREHERVRGRAGAFRPLAGAALDPERRAEAGERTIAGTFVRRSVFGAYVQELLREAIARQDGARQSLPRHRRGDRDPPSQRRLSAGDRRTAAAIAIDAAVLALGNIARSRRSRYPGYVDNPWSTAATAPFEPGRPVVVLGTGLTMVDVCLALTEQGFDGPIHAISRRGLLPLGHAPSTPWDEPAAACARSALPARAVPCGPPRGAPRRRRGRSAGER